MSEDEELKDCDEIDDVNERNACKINKFFGFRRGALGEDVMLEVLTPFFQKNNQQVSKLSRNYVAEDGKNAGSFVEFVSRNPKSEKIIEADIIVTNETKGAITKHCTRGYHTHEHVDKVVIIPVTDLNQKQLNELETECNEMAEISENPQYRIIRYDNVKELNQLVGCKNEKLPCTFAIPSRSREILSEMLEAKNNFRLKELEDKFNRWTKNSPFPEKRK